MHRKMPEKKLILMMAAVVFLSLLSGCSKGQKEESGLTELTGGKLSEEETEEAESGLEDTDREKKGFTEEEICPDTGTPGTVYVHVCGEVMCPGVYMLPSGSRLYEAIESAGGLRDSADGDSLNQAAQVEDGQQIYVPSREETAQGMFLGQTSGVQGASGNSLGASDGKIDLNTASKEQLMTLNGIGEAKAAAIIGYREEHGGFQKIEELMEVEGIKEGVFRKVKDQIKI